MEARSQPDGEKIEERSGLSRNGTVETHEDHTKREYDDGSDQRRMNESCSVYSRSNTPGQLSEGVKRRTTDPLQRPEIHKSEKIEAEDSDEQGESSCHPYEIKTEDREFPDCEFPDRSD